MSEGTRKAAASERGELVASSYRQLAEIYHDVLGAAILDWRARYTEQRTTAEAELREAKARRKARISTAIAAAALLVALGVGVLGWWAHQQQGTADSQRKTADAQRLVAQSVASLGHDPARSLVLTNHAYDLRPFFPDGHMIHIDWTGRSNPNFTSWPEGGFWVKTRLQVNIGP